MSRTLVVGYGNELYSDDGVGAYVVERLRGMRLEGSIAFRTCHQLLPELALEFAAASRLFLVDADVSLPAGQIRVRRVCGGVPPAVGHQWSAEALIGLAEALSQEAPRVRAYTIGVGSLAAGIGLSSIAKAAAERLVDHLATRLSPGRRRSFTSRP